MYTLQLLDWYSCATPVITTCLLEIIIVAWIYKADVFVDDIEFMIKRKVNPYWKFVWKYVTPFLLLVSCTSSQQVHELVVTSRIRIKYLNKKITSDAHGIMP